MKQVDKKQNSSSSIRRTASSLPVSSTFKKSNSQSASASTSKEKDDDEIQIISDTPPQSSGKSPENNPKVDEVKKAFTSDLEMFHFLINNPNFSSRFLNSLHSRIDFNMSPDVSSASPNEVSENTAYTFEENNEKMTKKVSSGNNSKDSEIDSIISPAGTCALKVQKVSESTGNILKNNDSETLEKNNGKIKQVSSDKQSVIKELNVHPSTTKVSLTKDSEIGSSISSVSTSASVSTSTSDSTSASVSTSTSDSTSASFSDSYQTTNIHERKNSQSASASTSNENEDDDNQVILQRPLPLSRLMAMSILMSNQGISFIESLAPNINGIYSMFQEMMLRLCLQMYVLLNNDGSTVHELALRYENVCRKIFIYRDKMEQLQKINNDLKKEKKTREHLLRALKEELECIIKSKTVYVHTMEAYKKRVLSFEEDHVNERDKISKEIQCCATKISDLKTLIKEKEEKLKFFSEKESELDAFLKHKDEQLTCFKEKMDEMETLISDKDEKLRFYEMKESDLKSSLKFKEEKLKGCEQKESQMGKTLREKEEKLQFCEEKLTDMKVSLYERGEKLEYCEKKLLEMKSSLKVKDVKCLNAEQKVEKLQHLLKDKDDEKLKFFEQKWTSGSDHKFHNSERLNQLITLLKDKNEKLLTFEQRINQLQDLVKSKEHQYEIREKEICQIYNFTKDKQFKMNTMQYKINQMETVLVDKEKKLLNYKQEVNHQASLLQDKSNELSQIEYEIESLQKENEILKKAKQDAIKSCNSFKIEYKKAVKKLTKLKHQMDSKKITNDAENQVNFVYQAWEGALVDEEEKVYNVDLATCIDFHTRNVRTVECQTEFFSELNYGIFSGLSDTELPVDFLSNY